MYAMVTGMNLVSLLILCAPKRRIPTLLIFAIGLAACDSSDSKWKELVEAADRETARTVVQYMSIQTMFPDPELRNLAKAAARGNLDSVRQKVHDGVDVNGRGVQNTTPLVWAMQNPSGFEALLELGADPNVVFGQGDTVIHWAAELGNQRLLKAALAHGGNPNLAAGLWGDTPLHRAATTNDVVFDELLRAGAEIDARDENGNTPVMVAAMVARYDLVLSLLEKGASFDVPNRHGLSLKNQVERDRRIINLEGDQGAFYSKVANLVGAGVDSPAP